MFVTFDDLKLDMMLHNIFMIEDVDNDQKGQPMFGVALVSTGGVPKILAFKSDEDRITFRMNLRRKIAQIMTPRSIIAPGGVAPPR